MVIEDVRVAAEPAGTGPPERVTPRIGSQTGCRGCGGDLVWDEVFGWLHLAAPSGSCPTPVPAPTP